MPSVVFLWKSSCHSLAASVVLQMIQQFPRSPSLKSSRWINEVLVSHTALPFTYHSALWGHPDFFLSTDGERCFGVVTYTFSNWWWNSNKALATIWFRVLLLLTMSSFWISFWIRVLGSELCRYCRFPISESTNSRCWFPMWFFDSSSINEFFSGALFLTLTF